MHHILLTRKRALFLIISLILSGTAATLAQRQQSTLARQWYDKETIYLLSPNRYVKNNVVYAGNNALKSEFMISPGGMQLYLQSRRNRNIGFAFSLVGSVGTIYTLVSGNRDAYKTLLWTSLGTGVASAFLNTRANTQLNQAIWLRNRDTMVFMESRE
jgi:hypothetical protein